MENVVSIVPNDELARKKKKKHVIDITFAKEALNNFSDAPTDGTSKKLVTWTFAIQQTEENKNWMDSLSTVMDTIRSGMKPEDAHLIEINRSSNKVSKVDFWRSQY